MPVSASKQRFALVSKIAMCLNIKKTVFPTGIYLQNRVLEHTSLSGLIHADKFGARAERTFHKGGRHPGLTALRSMLFLLQPTGIPFRLNMLLRLFAFTIFNH